MGQNKSHQILAGCKPEKLLVWKFTWGKEQQNLHLLYLNLT